MSIGPLGALLAPPPKRPTVEAQGLAHQAGPGARPAVTPGYVAAELREAACTRMQQVRQLLALQLKRTLGTLHP